jgi:Apea-like HEPN
MSTYDKLPLDRMVYGIVLNDLAAEVLSGNKNLGGWTLRRAIAEENSACSDQLRKYGALDFLGRPRQEATITPSGNGFRLEYTNDSSQWCYVIVERTANSILNGSDLAEATRLSDANLCIELWCAKKSPTSDGPARSIGGSPAQCVQFLGQAAAVNERHRPFDYEQVAEIVELRAAISGDLYPTIVNAIRMFRSLDVNPPSPAKTLGYFGVIESLLSHAPRPNDSADSITRQLKRNLILINNRMDVQRNIGFSEFGQTKPENVIAKLYDFRSAIAHGGDATDKIQHLAEIHNGWGDIAVDLWPDHFLRRLVKRVLVHAMREPQLIIDLKG